MGLGSGVVYSFVVLFLRALRDQSSTWLVALNLLGSAVVLGFFVLLNNGPTAFAEWLYAPSWKQLTVLAIFGAVQMAIPYWLFSRGLRVISSQEGRNHYAD